MLEIAHQSQALSTAGQLLPEQLEEIRSLGFKSVICNRPDGEGGDNQPSQRVILQAATALGLEFRYLPVLPGQMSAEQIEVFGQLMSSLPTPVLAYCRTGNRSRQLFVHSQSQGLTGRDSLDRYDVLVVGGGAAGIGVTASLLKRRHQLNIAIVEPSEHHYYQPAWTLVGGGAFNAAKTERKTADLIPPGADWIRAAVSKIDPDARQVLLSDGRLLSYQHLIVCTGLEICWDSIEGLEDTLGKHGVTSNYRYDLAPYTWELVQGLTTGTALFTQPPMPIKCAGAPQKAMYLSCDHWFRTRRLANIRVELNNAGAVLFGVPAFVPPLMKYVEKYGAHLAFQSSLVKVDGPSRTAWFDVKDADGQITRVAKTFDMLHVVPPQRAPDVVRKSALADAAGWCEVDPFSLQHVRYANVFSLGDVCSAPNAKTAAAVRKQIVVVAENLLAAMSNQPLPMRYDGYGSCPLTVEKGKVVLAEFGYGGKLLPTFPFDPTVARQSAWLLKAAMLPHIYWRLMLKGHEWLARPAAVD